MEKHRKTYKVNEYGVNLYPKGHIGRLLCVAAAIATLKRPTAASIATYVGLSKGNIDRIALIELPDQLGINVEKDGAVFKLVSWGKLVKKAEVMAYLKPNGMIVE